MYGEDNKSFEACAKVREVKAKVAQANFNHDKVTGDITFQQLSPFFPTQTSVRLRNLQKNAGSYHIHQYPVVNDKADNEDNPCTRTGGHFNPFNIDPSVSLNNFPWRSPFLLPACTVHFVKNGQKSCCGERSELLKMVDENSERSEQNIEPHCFF